GAGGALGGRSHQMEHAPPVTPDGGVEHDAARLLEGVVACLDAIHPNRPPEETRAVGVATFWHGLLGFDAGGHPITPVYMWADTRSEGEAQLLRAALDDEALHARTGCHLHSSYWPAKLRWLARGRPPAGPPRPPCPRRPLSPLVTPGQAPVARARAPRRGPARLAMGLVRRVSRALAIRRR